MVFGFFLLISSVFWFFNALNKEYYADLKVPVTYINLPENKLVAGPLASQVNVKITAFGHQVMNYKTSSISPAVINLSHHSLHPIPDQINKKYYLLTSSIKDEIANVLGPGIEIKSITPDSLFFRLEDVITKKLPVKSLVNIEFRKQYKMKDKILIRPDSLKIKGIASIIDTVYELFTEYKEFKDVDDSLNFMLDIKAIPGTEISPQMVNCIIPVERFTELSYKLPIEILNIPEGYKVKLFPDYAKVTCNVGFSRYQYIFKEQFRLVTDFSEVSSQENTRLLIRLVKQPEHISNIRIYPQTIDYIIEKND